MAHTHITGIFFLLDKQKIHARARAHTHTYIYICAWNLHKMCSFRVDNISNTQIYHFSAPLHIHILFLSRSCSYFQSNLCTLFLQPQIFLTPNNIVL